MLPLCKFIEIAVDQNLSALIISGFPSQIELQLAWAEIQQQYADVMGDAEHGMYKRLFADINLLAIKVQEVNSIVSILRGWYYAPLAERLNDLLNVSYEFNPYDNDAYQKLLTLCYNRGKAFKIDFDLKMIYFKSIQAKNSGNETTYTREYFQSVLITLSDHSKFPIQDSITVFEYCTRIKRFNDYCEQMKKRA
jgi:hypothetical protein